MKTTGKVVSVNISKRVGTPKRPVAYIGIDRFGVRKDAHRGKGHRQVSLLPEERIKAFSESVGRSIGYGDFAENITVSGLPLDTVKLFDRFRIGEAALQVTQIGKACHGDTCAIFREVGKCIMPEEGIFCRVIHRGRVEAGDTIEYVRRSLRISIITLSDRGSQGIYADESGPLIKRILCGFFAGIGWEADFSERLIPDEKQILKKAIVKAVAANTDIIFTTGGTGITKRDITPDVVRPMLGKEIPGIMESIRVKFAHVFPNAVLSRSIAGIIGRTLVYVIPGNPKAAKEYTEEIVKTIEHCILMISDVSKSPH